MKGQFAAALPSHIPVDRFLRVALTAVNRTPKLADCTQESLLEKLMDLAQLGLVADSVSGQAYLIPFKDKHRGLIVQLIVGFQGLTELAYRHPKVKSIRWSVVYEEDKFKWEEGLNPVLRHIPSSKEDRGRLTHAYAIGELDGGRTWIVLTKSEVMAAKSRSRSADSDYSPWNTDEPAMWAKTAVRRLAKQLPKSNELMEAMSRDDDKDYDMDIEASVVPSKLLEQSTVEKIPEKPQEPEKEPVRAGKAAEPKAKVVEPPKDDDVLSD